MKSSPINSFSARFIKAQLLRRGRHRLNERMIDHWFPGRAYVCRTGTDIQEVGGEAIGVSLGRLILFVGRADAVCCYQMSSSAHRLQTQAYSPGLQPRPSLNDSYVTIGWCHDIKSPPNRVSPEWNNVSIGTSDSRQSLSPLKRNLSICDAKSPAENRPLISVIN